MALVNFTLSILETVASPGEAPGPAPYPAPGGGGGQGWIPKEFWEGIMKPVASLAIMAVAMVLSRIQGLGLEGEMLYSITRAFLQLTVIGFVLHFIFEPGRSLFWIALAYLEMVVIAGYTAGRRAKHVPHGGWVAGASIFLGTSVTMTLLVALKVFPFTPRFIIPVAGMMVGNAMTVTGVAMKRLRDDVRQQLSIVEAALALGATPSQATHKQVKRALIVALAPVLDNAKTMGLISLPGTMTGLIMGGASPIEAVQLQIAVMNMLLGAATLSSLTACFLCWPRFFTPTYQLVMPIFMDE